MPHGESVAHDPAEPDATDPFAFGHAPLGRSVAWQLGSRFAVQTMALVVQVVLARMLLPEDFGAVAITVAIVSTLLLVVQSGFGVVVTQRVSLTGAEVSTLFWLSMAAAGLLYAAVWLTAEPLAAAFDDPRLVSLLRAVGSLLFVGAFTNIQTAIAMRRFLFRGVFWASCVGAVVSGATSIWLVFHGAGVWAVAAQTLTNQVVTALVMFTFVRWWPRLSWAPHSAGELMRQGVNLLVPNLLYGSFTGGTSLAIGRLYGPATLGYFDRGRLFTEFLFGSVNQAIQSAALPAMSRSQHDRAHLRQLVSVVLQASCMILFPAAIGFALVAPDLIPALLGATWAPAVPYVQLWALFFVHLPVSHTNQRAIIALGRSDLNLKLNVIEVVVAVLAVAAGAYLGGPRGLMVGMALSGLFNVALFSVPNHRLIGFGLWPQLRALAPIALATGVLAVVVWTAAVVTDDRSPVETLVVQVVAGVAGFLAAGWALRFLRPARLAELRRASA